MSRARQLDQFYTSAPVALSCWNELHRRVEGLDAAVFLEPSAGTGAFFKLMPAGRRIGLDLEPRCAHVAQADFFDWTPGAKVHDHPLVAVGNPPFGKNASLAVRFFNHAAKFSRVVAFVVPKTFRKASVQKRLDRQFHLVADVDLPADSFVFEGQPYDVPCSFQIWERTGTPRAPETGPLIHPDFEFVGRDQAHFAFRRVGAVAGRVLREFSTHADASHYFLRASIEPALLLERLEGIDWSQAKANNAGNPSISKRELVAEYAKLLAARR